MPRAKLKPQLTVGRRDPSDSMAVGLFRMHDRTMKEPKENQDGIVYEMHALTKEDIDNGHTQPYKQRLLRGKPIPVLKNKPYQVDYTFDGFRHEFIASEGLEWIDLKVYKGLLSLAYHNGDLLNESQWRDSEEYKKMTVKYPPNAGEPLLVHGSWSGLARELGLLDAKGKVGGRDLKEMRESLERLEQIKVKRINLMEAVRDDKNLSLDLIGSTSTNKHEFLLVLNPRVALALTQTVVGFTHFDMNELRSIKDPIVGLVHARLEALIAPGKSRKVGIDKLYRAVWGGKLDPKSSNHRMRLRNIRQAVLKIAELGWGVQEDLDTKDLWDFKRPALVGAEKQLAAE